MHVDDIDHTSQVTTAFTLIEHQPGIDPRTLLAQEDSGGAGAVVYTVECGVKTAQALKAKAWGILQALTPAALRVKDPAKVKAARKGKAKQEGTTAPVSPPAGSEPEQVADAPDPATDAPSGDQGDPEPEV